MQKFKKCKALMMEAAYLGMRNREQRYGGVRQLEYALISRLVSMIADMMKSQYSGWMRNGQTECA